MLEILLILLEILQIDVTLVWYVDVNNLLNAFLNYSFVINETSL